MRTRFLSRLVPFVLAATLACHKDGLDIKVFAPRYATNIQMFVGQGRRRQPLPVRQTINRQWGQYYTPSVVTKEVPTRLQFTIPLVPHVGCAWGPELRVKVDDQEYDVSNGGEPDSSVGADGRVFLTCFYFISGSPRTGIPLV